MDLSLEEMCSDITWSEELIQIFPEMTIGGGEFGKESDAEERNGKGHCIGENMAMEICFTEDFWGCRKPDINDDRALLQDIAPLQHIVSELQMLYCCYPIIIRSIKLHDESTGCNENILEEARNLFRTYKGQVSSIPEEQHFTGNIWRMTHFSDEWIMEHKKRYSSDWEDLLLSKFDYNQKYGEVVPDAKDDLSASFLATYRSLPSSLICKRIPHFTSIWNTVHKWNFSVEEVYLPSSYTIMDHKKAMVYPLIVGWDGKRASQLQDMSNGCNLKKYEKVDEPFSRDKARKKTMQEVSSFVIASTVFLWIIMDACSKFSIVQPKHGTLFIWSSLVEPFGFMVFVWVIAVTIVVGAQFSHTQSAMLMFWAILMVVKSAKSITEVCLPIFGILLTGLYVLAEKQPPHEG